MHRVETKSLRSWCNLIAHHIRYAILKQGLSLDDRAFYYLLTEQWSLSFLREYRNARRYVREIDPGKVKRIFVFSYSRSGTHNFYTRFHYSDSVFALKENLFHGPQNPYQFKTQPQDIKPRHVLGLSAFGVHGLQEKRGGDLTHLMFLNNYYLRDSYPLDMRKLQREGDRVLFYLRNFFRVIYSRDIALRRKGRRAAQIGDKQLESTFIQHRNKLDEMLSLHDLYPERTAFCFHELFCSQPLKTLDSVCDFIQLPREKIACWNRPQDFFKRCFASNDIPECKENKLWCPGRGQFIFATGGKYNPIPEPSIERTLKDDIHDLFTSSRIRMAEKVFGKSLVSFWMNDSTHTYESITNSHMLNIVRESLASCR